MVSGWRSQEQRVALVPTMGALHDGHLSLIRQAREHAAHVVVSIFVNPTQFGPGEDYEKYPRTLNRDVELCRQEGVALVFAPDFMEIYGAAGEVRQHNITFRIEKMNEHLCGPVRPGHFEGVLQVVNKLFNIVQPDVAVFGQKDIQQWFLIRQMVEEQDIPVDILMGATRREPDGLAQSSRNSYLSADERKKAPMLLEALQRVRHHLEASCRTAISGGAQIAPSDSGENAGKDSIENSGKDSAGENRYAADLAIISEEINRLDENGFRVEYFSLVTTPDLQPTDVIEHGRLYVIAIAARLGKTRLIDNVLFTYKVAEP